MKLSLKLFVYFICVEESKKRELKGYNINTGIYLVFNIIIICILYRFYCIMKDFIYSINSNIKLI